MNYLNIYQNLIKRAQSRLVSQGYTETHHIVPKSLGGSNGPENLVVLTAREHCLAHLLLAKIYGGSLWVAVALMTDRFKLTSKAYEITKKQRSALMSKKMKGNKLSAVHKNQKEKNGRFKGITVATNLETNKKIELCGRKEMQDFGFAPSTVYKCLNKKQKSHRGFTFERKVCH